MPYISADKAKSEYDVVIVGSGAGGGQAAYTLTLAGLKCVMLEAGRRYDPVTETPMWHALSEAPLMATRTPDKPFGFHDATVNGGWAVPGEPYTSTHKEPIDEFKWWRSRMMGGRTNHWGRISLRNGQYDFKPRSRDGLGFDWPIDYADVEPYYTKVEMLIGVYGSNEGLENTPDSPDGVLLPPPKARAAELLAQKHGKTLGIPIIPIHRAVLTKHLDYKTIPAKLHPGDKRAQKIVQQAMAHRSACFWATPCGRGCSVAANYQSTTVHLPPALATGDLDIISDAHCREVLMGKDGRASGILFIDKTTGKATRVKGKVVILAASACETVRILLNSADGKSVANSSGLVGKYIMDTVGTRISGQVPALENLLPHNEDGAGGDHLYAPWWLYQQQKAGKLDFARGYHIEFGGTRQMPGGSNPVPDEYGRGSYGTKFKEDARRYYGSFVSFAVRGEMIPNEQCYMDLDPKVTDHWGVPVARFHWRWSEHELNQATHGKQTFRALIEEMGGTAREVKDPAAPGGAAIEKPGSIIHEVGGALPGTDPAKSVCDGFNRTHDVKNLFLCDGAPFASNADKNPTLTIMALAWRACDYIVEQAKKGSL